MISSYYSVSRYRHGYLYNSNTMETIELRDVNVSLGGNSILNDMSMSVEPGRVHALLGRNGAGKSTAFKTILGLVSVTSGTVNIFGEPLNAEHRRDIGASINGRLIYVRYLYLHLEHLNLLLKIVQLKIFS